MSSIEIFENEKPDVIIRITLQVLRAAEKLLPKRMSNALAGEDIDFKALLGDQ